MKRMSLVVMGLVLLLIFFAPLVLAGFDIYYNNPPNANYIDLRVSDVIDSAESYCYVAIYGLNRERIVDSLIAAKVDGVDVRVVTDTDYRYKTGYTWAYDELASYGIPVVCDGRTALMHNKFVVVDGTKTVTGSYNFTDDQTTDDKNNVIIVTSSGIATRYTNEFLQMYNGTFGVSKVNYSGTNIVDGSTVYTKFSPKANIRTSIIYHIGTASSNIYFNIFTFTDQGIANELIDRKNAGVTVRGTFDAWQAGSAYSQHDNLDNAGIPVKEDTYNGFLHDKYIAIDGGTESEPRTITGSFNWTASADTTNDENLMVIKDATVTNSYRGNAIYVYNNKAQ